MSEYPDSGRPRDNLLDAGEDEGRVKRLVNEVRSLLTAAGSRVVVLDLCEDSRVGDRIGRTTGCVSPDCAPEGIDTVGRQ